MPKNYYVVLGLNTTASPRQIKDAYRRLAKELHPDRSGLESEPFREVQEAYGVLSDPIQRRHYHPSQSVVSIARFPVAISGGVPFTRIRAGGENLDPPRKTDCCEHFIADFCSDSDHSSGTSPCLGKIRHLSLEFFANNFRPHGQ